jgi:hypothetical protein
MRVIIMTLLGSENYLQNELQRKNTHELQSERTENGAPGWIRTSDLPLRRRLLYPLSYGRL